MHESLKPSAGHRDLDDKEVSEMLSDVESGLHEQGARAQALAANSMLALLGQKDFSKLKGKQRDKWINDIFRLCAYALAGMPVVYRAVGAVHDMNTEKSVAATVRALALLFDTDPEPLIKVMLSGPEATVRSNPRPLPMQETTSLGLGSTFGGLADLPEAELDQEARRKAYQREYQREYRRPQKGD